MTAPTEQILYYIWVGDTSAGGIMNVNVDMLQIDSILARLMICENDTAGCSFLVRSTTLNHSDVS
ncbi:MAG: hypothetical protein ACI8Z5_001824 [Lentimonas sp.]|jgi:hypothetical protein